MAVLCNLLVFPSAIEPMQCRSRQAKKHFFLPFTQPFSWPCSLSTTCSLLLLSIYYYSARLCGLHVKKKNTGCNRQKSQPTVPTTVTYTGRLKARRSDSFKCKGSIYGKIFKCAKCTLSKKHLASILFVAKKLLNLFYLKHSYMWHQWFLSFTFALK